MGGRSKSTPHGGAWGLREISAGTPSEGQRRISLAAPSQWPASKKTRQPRGPAGFLYRLTPAFMARVPFLGLTPTFTGSDPRSRRPVAYANDPMRRIDGVADRYCETRERQPTTSIPEPATKAAAREGIPAPVTLALVQTAG
jgi:hypothetical protein